MNAFRAIVSGRVQLVMYRDFAQRKARGLGVVGTVKNLPDGTVEVVAEGEKDVLEKYIALLKRGPVLAQVDAVAVVWQKPTDMFQGFSIT
jgi:acylphosphatase